MRAAEELLAVTRKLKQLWILSESKDEGREHNGVVDNALEVDVAKQLQRIIRKEINEDKNGVQQDNDEKGGEIQID